MKVNPHTDSLIIPPKLAIIGDLTGFGRCSLSVAVPVVSAMKVQACPVPTSVLSNHLGFPDWSFHDFTPYLPDFLEQWKQQQLTFDGICCGFLGNEMQADMVSDFVSTQPDATFLLDPVLGDHGRFYSSVTPARCEKVKQLAASAHLLTPNITEACLLTGTPYQEDGWTYEMLCDIADALHKIGPGKIAITGIQEKDGFLNLVSRWDKQQNTEPTRTFCHNPVQGNSRPGTGDLFAAILAAGILKGLSLEDCVKKAASFIGMCTEGSDSAGIPIREGVLFENYLYLLSELNNEFPHGTG